MLRKVKLAAVIAVAISAVGIMDSADAHIGGRGGGIRIGGGLVPRARQQGNGIRNGGNNGVAGRTTPAPKAATAPPIVQISGTNSSNGNKLPSANSATKTVKASSGNVTSTNSVTKSNAPQNTSEKVQSPPVQASVTAKAPADNNYTGLLVFNLTGNAAPAPTPEVEQNQPTGLSSETKKALEDALAAEAPAAETAPTEVASKELASKDVALPQIPVGATVTLNGKDLSDKEGQVVLQIGDIALPATITAWKNNMVTCTLPVLGLTKTSKATLHVLKADGQTASLLHCELIIALPPR